jgi:alanine racemase
MDLTLVDVTDIPGVHVGDEVVLFGKQEGQFLPVEEMAEAIDTIPYEILCNVGKRVPRGYRS